MPFVVHFSLDNLIGCCYNNNNNTFLTASVWMQGFQNFRTDSIYSTFYIERQIEAFPAFYQQQQQM